MNKIGSARSRAYQAFCLIIMILLALLFIFPLYWIIIGTFKTSMENYSTTPIWWPSEWSLDNLNKLLAKRSAPL